MHGPRDFVWQARSGARGVSIPVFPARALRIFSANLQSKSFLGF
jgi:hypothetical protein